DSNWVCFSFDNLGRLRQIEGIRNSKPTFNNKFDGQGNLVLGLIKGRTDSFDPIDTTNYFTAEYDSLNRPLWFSNTNYAFGKKIMAYMEFSNSDSIASYCKSKKLNHDGASFLKETIDYGEINRKIKITTIIVNNDTVFLKYFDENYQEQTEEFLLFKKNDSGNVFRLFSVNNNNITFKSVYHISNDLRKCYKFKPTSSNDQNIDIQKSKTIPDMENVLSGKFIKENIGNIKNRTIEFAYYNYLSAFGNLKRNLVEIPNKIQSSIWDKIDVRKTLKENYKYFRIVSYY
ncbi:MAG: hypothetical protein IAF38_02315, partial [Bacteroidia bacterium]|nr:hypothetical protein [Bacteroidia bacterium]